jgi:hypothetical protein
VDPLKGPWVLDWLSRPLVLGEVRKLENLLKRQKGGAGLQKLKVLHGSQSRGRGIAGSSPAPATNSPPTV